MERMRVVANGLEHNVLAFAPRARAVKGLAPRARAVKGGSDARAAVALLLHGYMDAAATWDLVAPHLAAGGVRVLAPDFRGFGDGPRVPDGFAYHFPDYIADVAELVDVLVPPDVQLYVVGHSMGGTAATLYAGSFPERVTKLALLEGLGPPDNPFDVAPDRMRRWIDETRQQRARGDGARAIGTMDDALRRLSANHPLVPVEALRTRVPLLTRPLDDDGTLAWRVHARHRVTSPFPFFAASYCAFAARVTCPVLFVDGGPEGLQLPDDDDRKAAFTSAVTTATATLPGAGHMMHWTRGEEVAEKLLGFWRTST